MVRAEVWLITLMMVFVVSFPGVWATRQVAHTFFKPAPKWAVQRGR